LNIKVFRRLIKYIGPYPYNPYLIFLFFSALFFSRFLPLIAYLPVGHERWRAGGIIILVSAIPGGSFAIGALLLNKYRLWSSKSTVLYVLEVAIFQLLNLHFFPQINAIVKKFTGQGYETLVALSFNIFIASLSLVLLSLALMHQAERKISERLLLANKLVDKLENERAELVNSDEALRKQASQFLHDRVQSDLMVVGIKLKSISGQSSPEVNKVIEKAIIRLERTRAADLKNLIQILTPNLGVETLFFALDALIEQHRQSMKISLGVEATCENLTLEIKLGIYRIIEQAILNALIHGPAKRVQINIDTDSSGLTTVIVSDDGPGATLEKVSPGVGSAIIDSWVGILGGKRSIDTSPGHGYRLEVEIPQ
jgi:signal transduction histidine kinase